MPHSGFVMQSSRLGWDPCDAGGSPVMDWHSIREEKQYS